MPFDFEQFRVTQYEVLTRNRCATDTMLWQAPAIALAGQSFLLAVALNSALSITPRIVADMSSFVISLAAVQLLRRHRFLERRSSDKLKVMEQELKLDYPTVHILHDKPEPPDNSWWFAKTVDLSSVYIWTAMLLALGLVGFYPIVAHLFSLESKSL